MARHIRNLLMIAALCWVAPAFAEQRLAKGEQGHGSGCPDAQRTGQVVVVVSEQALGEVPISAGLRAFMP